MKKLWCFADDSLQFSTIIQAWLIASITSKTKRCEHEPRFDAILFNRSQRKIVLISAQVRKQSKPTFPCSSLVWTIACCLHHQCRPSYLHSTAYATPLILKQTFPLQQTLAQCTHCTSRKGTTRYYLMELTLHWRCFPGPTSEKKGGICWTIKGKKPMRNLLSQDKHTSSVWLRISVGSRK